MPVNIPNAVDKKFDDDSKLLVEDRKSMLFEMISKKSDCHGESVMIDRIGDGEPATESATGIHEQGGIGDNASDIASLVAQMTEHMEGEHLRSILVPRYHKWGYHFNQDDELQTFLRETDRLAAGVRKVRMSKDDAILRALFAASVARFANGSAVTQAFPAAQQRVFATLGYGIFTSIATAFEDNGADDEEIYAVMRPNVKGALIVSDDKIKDQDFRGPVAHGAINLNEIGKISNITPIAHPRVPMTSDGKYQIGFFTRSALVWGIWKGFYTKVGETPLFNFRKIAGMYEVGNCVRPDDKRVMWGKLNVDIDALLATNSGQAADASDSASDSV